MLFKKYYININIFNTYINDSSKTILVEVKYRNNPKYQLLPAKGYSYVNKKGKTVIVSNPRRWKKIDKDNKKENKNLNKEFSKDKDNEFNITLKTKDNTEIKITINYNSVYENFYILSDIHKFEIIDLNENYLLTDPYHFSNKIFELKDKLEKIEKISDKDIEKYIGEFIDNVFFSIAIDNDDNIKIDYLRFFASGDFILFFEPFVNYLMEGKKHTIIPQYRHFLQLMLSLEDYRILKDELYRDLFKALLFLDWTQNKENNASFLETMFFYYSTIFGKDKILKFFEWNENDYKYLDKLTINKIPTPIPKINLNTFNEAMKIVKEMYDETQEVIKKEFKKGKSNKLYRGLLLTFENKEDLELFINNLREKKNKNEMLQYVTEILGQYPKLFESWSYSKYIAISFSKMEKDVETMFKLSDIKNMSKESFKKTIEDIDSVSIVLKIPEKYFKNAIFHYKLYNKYISKISQNAKGFSMMNYYYKDGDNIFELLPNNEYISDEYEVVLFNTAQLINENNIERIIINKIKKNK